MQAAGSGSGGGRSGALYAGLRARHRSGPVGEINVTPLVDVVLVLLLVFMVTAPMMDISFDIRLPQAKTQRPVDKQDRIRVEMFKDGRIQLDGKLVDSAMLQDRLKTMIEGKPDKVVYLRADEGLPYGRVISTVDVIKRAGVETVGFVYQIEEPKKK